MRCILLVMGKDMLRGGNRSRAGSSRRRAAGIGPCRNSPIPASCRLQAHGEEAMITVHEEYLVDGQGNKKSVVVPMEEWKQIVEALE